MSSDRRHGERDEPDGIVDACGLPSVPLPKRGIIATIIQCPKCLRIVDTSSSAADCPEHHLPCCGGQGTMHVPGCKQDPAFQAGRRRATEREQAVLAAFFARPITPGESRP